MNEKIKDEALKQLFKLKVEQLNHVHDTFVFTHPMAQETIWMFSHSFNDMYEDERMLSILDQVYNEFQTNESREKLFESMKQWADNNNYAYEQVFK